MGFNPDEYLKQDVQKKSGFDPDAYLSTGAPQEESLGSKVLGGLAKVGETFDSYTGAPTRAAIGSLQDGGSLPEAGQAFVNQFGEHPQFAPTGKEIAKKAGVTDRPLSDFIPGTKYAGGGLVANPFDTPVSSAAGFAVDVAADPTLYIPAGAIAKGVKAGAETAKEIPVAANIVGAIERSGAGLGKITQKVGSTLTGLPEKNIETYIRNTKQVDDIIKATGGDVTVAADELRAGLKESIQKKISELGSNIKDAIKNAPAGSVESNSAIMEALQKSKSAINPDLYPEAVAEIQDLINKVSKIGTDGKLDAAAANEAKAFLQDIAKGSYVKSGAVFTPSDKASRAAKAGASQARKIEMGLAPETIEPNRQLSKLHRFEKDANKNLFAEGKSESALMSAGSGQNLRNTKNLRDIGELTGFDALGGAENLSAARAFGRAGLDPVDNTGKALYRAVLGGSIGGAVAGPVGGMIGTIMSSPYVLKKAIQAGDVSKDLILKLAKTSGDVTDAVLTKAIKMANTEEGLALIRAAGTSQVAIKQSAIAAQNPKGIEKWVADGKSKITNSDASLDPEFLDQVKSNKKFKDILIRAGSLRDGSTQLKQSIDKIKSSPEYKQFIKEKEKQAQGKEPDSAQVKPQIKFPLVVQKDGYTAVVRNADELSEARSEGWA